MYYQRQIQVIGKKANEKLRKSTAAIVGMGGIGTVAAELLARAGINLVLIDFDFVDETNLQRQLLFDMADLGKPKVNAAAEKLGKINPDIKIKTHNTAITEKNTSLLDAGIILDCTDNFDARYLINEFAVKNKIPLVVAAAVKNKCMLFCVTKSPCLECIIPRTKSGKTCCEEGILAPATTTIGALQASEAIKILIGKKPLDRLLYADLNFLSFDFVKVKPSKNCKVCIT